MRSSFSCCKKKRGFPPFCRGLKKEHFGVGIGSSSRMNGSMGSGKSRQFFLEWKHEKAASSGSSSRPSIRKPAKPARAHGAFVGSGIPFLFPFAFSPRFAPWEKCEITKKRAKRQREASRRFSGVPPAFCQCLANFMRFCQCLAKCFPRAAMDFANVWQNSPDLPNIGKNGKTRGRWIPRQKKRGPLWGGPRLADGGCF